MITLLELWHQDAIVASTNRLIVPFSPDAYHVSHGSLMPPLQTDM